MTSLHNLEPIFLELARKEARRDAWDTLSVHAYIRGDPEAGRWWSRQPRHTPLLYGWGWKECAAAAKEWRARERAAWDAAMAIQKQQERARDAACPVMRDPAVTHVEIWSGDGKKLLQRYPAIPRKS